MSTFKGPASLLDAISKVVKDDRAEYFAEQQKMDKLVAEKMLSPKQKKIAAAAGDPDKIDAADFAALRAGKVKKMGEEVNIDEAKYSATAARHGEDIGKPGKNFKKIASLAAKKYGSKEAGGKVAGAILKNIRQKHMGEDVEHLDESVKAAKAAAAEAHAKGMSLSKADDHIFNAVNAAYKGKSEGASGGVTRARINHATDTGLAHFKKLSGMNEEVEQIDEISKETKNDFKARQERLAAASAQTAKDPARLARLSKIPGYTAAMDLAKKTTQKEEVDQLDSVLESIISPVHASNIVADKFNDTNKYVNRVRDVHKKLTNAGYEIDHNDEQTKQGQPRHKQILAGKVHQNSAGITVRYHKPDSSSRPIRIHLASDYGPFNRSTPKHTISGSPDTTRKQERKVAGHKLKKQTNEERDTPGNGREHQCAIHVKSEQFGEGRTLTTQHAEPDELGNIAWYDVMFEHGIERVASEDLEILVSEAHVHSKKAMKEETGKTLSNILEGRGRPRKNPDDPKWKKMEAKPKVASSEDDSEEDHGPARPGSPHLTTEPDKHISVQLKVAQDMKDEKGGADVKFANGKTHFVKHDVASKVLGALDKLKPADRANAHDHIAQSHENLMQVHKILS